MPDMWGALMLNISSYKRAGAERYFTEKELLAPYDARDKKTPNSVLMGTGRKRKTREVEGFCTRLEYSQLLIDYQSSEAKALAFDDGFTMTARLWKLSGKEEKGSGLVWYQATFIES